MTSKSKKIIITIAVVFVAILIIFSFLLQSPAFVKRFLPTTPVIPTSNLSPTPTPTLVHTTPVVPRQTDINSILKTGDIEKSDTEMDKIADDLPIRVNNFTTSLNQKTTINIFTLPSEPTSLLHIEIYGVNYNHPEIDQSDALAFKESFLLAKKALTSRGVDIKNLQLVFGNRQYIQDTATYWVSSLGLLN